MDVGFIGREAELSELERMYASKLRLKTMAIYGRRRIGKTTLISRFCRGKPSIHITFTDGSDRQNLDRFERIVSEYTGVEKSYANFSDMIFDLADIISKERTVLVFDNLSAYTQHQGYLHGLIQWLIDHRLSHSMLIISGIDLDGIIHDSTKPLYGRFVDKLKLRPLDFQETLAFHPNMSDMDALKLHLTIGGLPLYHAVNDADTFRENIIRNLLSGDSMMRYEYGNLRCQLRDPRGSSMITEAVASGADRLTQISERTGIDKSTCRRIIADLTKEGILKVITPMYGSPKHPRYRIGDPVVGFHHRVLSLTNIWHIDDPDELYDRLEPRIDAYLNDAFRDLCESMVIESYQTKKIGRCWGMFRDEPGAEIPVAARVRGESQTDYTLFAGCGFHQFPMGENAYRTLMRRVESLGLEWMNTRYALFSPSGFTYDLVELAEDRDIMLFDLDVICGKSPIPKLP